jgi:hypothetical protein
VTGKSRRRRSERLNKREVDAPSPMTQQALFDLLWEQSFDDVPEGWYLLPWRRASCAIALALDLYTTFADAEEIRDEVCTLAQRALHAARDGRKPISCKATAERERIGLRVRGGPKVTVRRSTYWRTEELLPYASHVARAVLRCVQLWAADSSGGGHVYNNLLTDLTRRVGGNDRLDQIRSKVEIARLHDALGETAPPQLQQAFLVAWRAGRYTLAYALTAPPKTE